MVPSLKRDLSALSSGRFDLLVVGGGIYGLTIACDAAQRGLHVGLIEQNDFGSGTSFNHLRTIHGGLRYLQTLDLRRARESVRERRTIARIAPWAVQPLPFVLPLTRSLTRGPLAMRAGFALDALVARDRNEGVPVSHRLPTGQVIGGDEARSLHPVLSSTEMTGAAVWSDYVTTDADRLTLAWALEAAAHGAVLANYVEATGLVTRDGAVGGATVVDRPTGSPFVISANVVVNATGAAMNRLLEPFGVRVPLPLVQAMNLVTRLDAPRAAIGGRSAIGRNLFLVPWRGRALFGTWESPTTVGPDALTIGEADIDAFVTELNQAFPSIGLRRGDITLVHRGVVPAQVDSSGRPSLDGRELVFEHHAGGLARTISVAGTKYTTARAVAERIVNRVFEMQARVPPPCISAERPLPHVDLTGDALLRHAAAHEMVVTLADAVVRRTPLGALGRPDDADLRRAATIVGDTLGWDAERRRDETGRLLQWY